MAKSIECPDNTEFTFRDHFILSKDEKQVISYVGNINDKSVTIPDGITSIGDYAFLGSELTNVTIPNSVTSIGVSAFVNNQLTEVTIPNSVRRIEERAFSYNLITRISIGANVELGEYAFNVIYGNDFISQYNSSFGKAAGTYVLGYRWQRQ